MADKLTAQQAVEAIAGIVAAVPTDELPDLTERDGTLWHGGTGWPDSRKNRDTYRNRGADWRESDIWVHVMAAESARREILRRDDAGIPPAREAS